MQAWYTRAIVMHKVAEPAHLHYLHWRLSRCAVPFEHLNSSAAVDSARASLAVQSGGLGVLGRAGGGRSMQGGSWKV